MHLDLQVIHLLLTKEMVSGRRWMSDQEQEVFGNFWLKSSICMKKVKIKVQQ